MSQSITSLPQDLFIHSDALHPWGTRRPLSVGASEGRPRAVPSPRVPPADKTQTQQTLRGRSGPSSPPDSDELGQNHASSISSLPSLLASELPIKKGKKDIRTCYKTREVASRRETRA
jgi:hypothetical protein